jgi:hypothetical protein
VKGCQKRSSRSPTTIVDEWNGRGCESSYPGGPYIEFGARAHTRRRLSMLKGREPKGGPS